ncbi:MAG TPA: hypothetical protein VK752_22290 [Bryobacteraceae bacterium]|jgi:hypothetical protein|nr:hypothetical protein [Bryobacteraceae bacterium]
MKIVSQSSDELVLKEGSTQGIVVGSVLVVAGVLAGIFLRDANPYMIWIALAAALVGIAVILFSSSITVTANKTSGQVLYQKKRIVGGQDSNYAIAEIFRIETRKQWQVQNAPPSGNQQPSMPQLVAQSVIVFKDGREVPLDHQKTSSTTTVGPVVLMGGQGAETAIAAQVAKFLNVPFQEIAPPNMGMSIQL